MSDLRESMVVLDFGGQYAHLIASRIRRFGYPAYIVPQDIDPQELAGVAGIILSGGPQSVYEEGSPQADKGIFALGVPILGLCYGHQWLAHALGGKVAPAAVKEYGLTNIHCIAPSQVFRDLPSDFSVWMSHGDEVSVLPPGFLTLASSDHCKVSAMMDPVRRIFGIQFHIEVTHTKHGMEMLRSFVELCQPKEWSVKKYVDRVSDQIQTDIGDRKVFMLVSGGVDSTVAFTLLNRVLGPERVQGLLIDTGLMRENEVANIQKAFAELGITNLAIHDASNRFFQALRGVYDPEQKRKIIGETFLAIQKEVSESMNLRIDDGWMLGQGTIYPDTIETGGTKHAATIKTHHNRIEMIQSMIEQGFVIEPLKELYKDEVRMLGEELGLPHDLVWRHPFPGPGLGVRILCAEKAMPAINNGDLDVAIDVPSLVLPVRSVGVQGDGRTYRQALALFSTEPLLITSQFLSLATSIPNASRIFNRVLLCTSHATPFDPVFTPTYITSASADLLRKADSIVDEETRHASLEQKIWQFPVVLLPFGVQDGGRSIVLRPIESTDAMTANAFALSPEVLKRMTARILALEGIDAVFVDLTNKPPGTIEWE